MTGLPRLTKRKDKGGRRIVLCCLVVIVAVAGWLLDRQYGLVAVVVQGLSDVQNTISPREPARGILYDRNMRQLAINVAQVSVYLRSREVESIPHVLMELAGVLPIDRQKVQAQLESGSPRHWIATGISEEQEEAISQLNLNGVYLQRDDKRYYPGENLAAHLVGYAENGIGLSGIEYHYDRLLADLRMRQQEARQPLSPALDLVLTVDLKIQTILEQLLYEVVGLNGVQRVASYILDGESGALIAGAQLPSFNPNTFTQYRQEILDNMFFSPVLLPDRFRQFIRDAAFLQTQSAKSDAVGAWPLFPDGEDLGSQLRLWDQLGLGELPDTDFHISNPNRTIFNNSLKAVSRSQISYGLVPELSTPLSLLSGMAILLGDGHKIRPFAVHKILDGEAGQEILMADQPSDQPGAEFLLEIPELDQLFISQSEKGSARARYFHDSIVVSQPEGHFDRRLIHDMVYMLLPAGIHDLHMLVLVERWPAGVVQSDQSIGEELLPILEKRVERISVLQQVGKSVEDYVEPGAVDVGNYPGGVEVETALPFPGAGGNGRKELQRVMPDLTGLSLRKSLRLLHGMQLEIAISGTGWVVAQKPLPGTPVQGGEQCQLILEKKENLNLPRLSNRPVE